ncbi:MAG: tetratricopeptide repeat protein, partial [Candidatus Heimdallarchaeaceae archaeon]
MFSISDPKLETIGKDLIEGRSKNALKTLNSVLDTEQMPIIEKIDYQLLKVQALLNLGNFNELTDYFGLIWNEIKEQGTELQRIDLLVLKARFVHDSLDGPNKNNYLIEEFENLFHKSDKKQSIPYLQRYALFLNFKRYLSIFQIKDVPQKQQFVKEALKISEEIDYDYGIVFSIIKSTGDFGIEEKDEVHELVKKAFRLCEKNKNSLLLGLIYNAFWVLNSAPNELEIGFEYLNKANRIFKKIEAKNQLSDNHNNKTFYFQARGEYDKIILHLEKSYKIACEIGYKGREVIALHNLGTAYLIKMEYSKAIPYLEKGLAIAQEIGGSRMPYLFLRVLGGVYFGQGELSKALKILHVALENSQDRDHKNDIATLKSVLMKVYLAKGELNRALEYTSSIDYYEEVQHLYLLCDDLRVRGEILQLMGDYDAALVSYERSIEISKKLENNHRLAEVYFSLVPFYIETKDLENAKKIAIILESVSENSEEKLIKSRSLLASALVLKESHDKDEQLNSKNILEEVIGIEDQEFSLLVPAILSLCELLLLELKTTENLDLLEKLSNLTEELHVKAIQQNIFPLIAQTVW